MPFPLALGQDPGSMLAVGNERRPRPDRHQRVVAGSALAGEIEQDDVAEPLAASACSRRKGRLEVPEDGALGTALEERRMQAGRGLAGLGRTDNKNRGHAEGAKEPAGRGDEEEGGGRNNGAAGQGSRGGARE